MCGYLKQSNIKILAHRGYWKSKDEQNTKIAFQRAFDCGFGVETDLRDVKGEIVISHNMPKGDEMTFVELLQILDGRDLTLALNIKADGLADEIKRLLDKYSCTNYFTFDMSIPEMVYQNKLKLNVFCPYSDIVKTPVMFDEAEGVWLDCFNSDWFYKEDIENLLNKNKKVAVVSPDLHKRDYKSIWQRYKDIKNIMICTDYPMEALRYFNE